MSATHIPARRVSALKHLLAPLLLAWAAGCIPADFGAEPQQVGADLAPIPGDESSEKSTEVALTQNEQLDEDIAAAAPSAERRDLPKGQLEKAPELRPKGMRFGMTAEQIAKVYDKVIDQDYLPKYEDVEPGVQMQTLDREIEEKKMQLRRERIEFDGTPTGLEGTALQNEFTHHNNEAMMVIPRPKKKRHIFFINDKAWKVIDVYKLGDKSRWGADFNAAVKKLTEILKGPEGLRLDAEPSIGRHEEVVWMDGQTLLRLINMGDDEFAIGYVDQKVAENITTLRKNTGKPTAD